VVTTTEAAQTTTTAERYERAAQALGLLRGALLTDDADSAIAGAFTALGILWGTEARPIWEEASGIAQELGKPYKVPELHERVGGLRDLLVAEAMRLRRGGAPVPGVPQVLIMVESDLDEPGCLMGGPFLICPYESCDAEDEIKRVELVTYLHPVRVNDEHDGLIIGDGGGGDSEDQDYICGGCNRPVDFPKNIEGNRSWW
jgi:hypothetical protein